MLYLIQAWPSSLKTTNRVLRSQRSRRSLSTVQRKSLKNLLLLSEENVELRRLALLYHTYRVETTDMKGLKKIEDHWGNKRVIMIMIYHFDLQCSVVLFFSSSLLQVFKSWNRLEPVIAYCYQCETYYKLNNIVPSPRFAFRYSQLHIFSH